MGEREIFRRGWGFFRGGDLKPEIGEISLNLGLNSKTGEKSPEWGVHTGMVAGQPWLASKGLALRHRLPAGIGAA